MKAEEQVMTLYYLVVQQANRIDQNSSDQLHNTLHTLRAYSIQLKNFFVPLAHKYACN